MDVHSPCGRDYAVIDEAIDGRCAALARGAGRGIAVVSIIVHSPARSFRVYGGLKHPGKPHRVGPSLRFESGVNQFKPICGTSKKPIPRVCIITVGGVERYPIKLVGVGD